MRLLLTALVILFSSGAAIVLACDTGSYPTIFEMADAADLVAVGRATSASEIAVRRTLHGTRVSTVTFGGSTCDPVLVAGHDYVVFVRGAPGRQEGVGFNESAIDLAGERVPPAGRARMPVERRGLLRALSRWFRTPVAERATLLREWRAGSGLLAAEAGAQRGR